MADRFPEWLVPMAATLTQERFAGPDWLFERKLDGIRLLAYKPAVVVQVAFLEWTGRGHDAKMRHSRLLGFRTDKRARDVVRET